MNIQEIMMTFMKCKLSCCWLHFPLCILSYFKARRLLIWCTIVCHSLINRHISIWIKTAWNSFIKMLTVNIYVVNINIIFEKSLSIIILKIKFCLTIWLEIIAFYNVMNTNKYVFGDPQGKSYFSQKCCAVHTICSHLDHNKHVFF